MKGLSKATMVIAKVLEVFGWIAAALMLIFVLWVIFAPGDIIAAISEDVSGAEYNALGLHVSAEFASLGVQVSSAGVEAEGMSITRGGLLVLGLMSLLLIGLMTMVFRNVYLIIRTSRGETRFARGATPFQPDNIRMLREIGIFTIAIPILEVVVSALSRLIVGAEYVDISVDMSHIFLGLLVLWLTQVFAYGAELQVESDGLI